MLANEERVRTIYHEMNELWLDSFNRGGANVDIPPLMVNWRAYIELNNQDRVKLYTVRDKTLRGFVMYMVYPHLHHVDTINAECVALIVHLDERGRGLGRALMQYAEPKLKDLGVRYITHHFRTCYDAQPLFPKLGYKLVEHAYLKDIS
jgi:GNAT superfamily N-acetyltransferase